MCCHVLVPDEPVIDPPRPLSPAFYATPRHAMPCAGTGFATCSALFILLPELGSGHVAAVADDVKRWLRLCGQCISAHPW